ncbi:hypothetical protein [Laceyella sacchari]|uniref:Uncharacterized protein n=1 Tax=Laceyella sacchari TaxID=37482 RepID=A0ABY5U4K3_LACSH|nr:hypothetical protein [Laceyella sacchari]TCW40924.1 hypothetical protein EDC32_101580 [Laceyella sacchari]UWE04538.1 hypothetical protein NYR52_05185 [Laceyella sacchari]
MTKEEKIPTHPRFLPYTQVAMGMIQPEWIFMNHFFEREDMEEEQLDSTTLSISTIPPSETEKKAIQIHFHARREPRGEE